MCVCVCVHVTDRVWFPSPFSDTCCSRADARGSHLGSQKQSPITSRASAVEGIPRAVLRHTPCWSVLMAMFTTLTDLLSYGRERAVVIHPPHTHTHTHVHTCAHTHTDWIKGEIENEESGKEEED